MPNCKQGSDNCVGSSSTEVQTVEIAGCSDNRSDRSSSPGSPGRIRQIVSSADHQRLIELKANSDLTSKTATQKAKEILLDVKDIKQAQLQIGEQLKSIRKENNVLYEDVHWVRETLTQQQVVVDKLIHFLMSMVGGRRTFLKRSFPFILEDADIIEKKANQLKYVQTDDSGIQLEEVMQVAKKTPAILFPALEVLPDTGSATNSTQPTVPSVQGSAAAVMAADVPDPVQLVTCDVAMDSASAVKTEIKELTAELQQDLDSLKDMMKSTAGIGLPFNTVEKLFDGVTTDVPAVPQNKLAETKAEAGAAGPAPVPIASVIAPALEAREIKQQELVDLACAVVPTSAPSVINNSC